MKVDLKLDWATHEAAKYACEHWHYSGCIPKSKLVKIGVWEDGKFIGVVIFSSGATPQIGSPFGLTQTEVCELTRIALDRHRNPVSRIVSVAIRFLKRSNPGLRLIVSYADRDQNHVGGIYQAGNWAYVGQTKPDTYLRIRGELKHRKAVYTSHGCQSLEWIRKHVDPTAERVSDSGKHKYLMPLDDEMRRRIEPLRKPYPKRAGSKENVAAPDQGAEGGVIPTPALQQRKADATHSNRRR